MEMREMVRKILSEKMKEDKRFIVLDADLARALGTAPLYKEFPDQTCNVGIAESNMIGIAAGLAAYGFVPMTFTFATFSSRRVCDQIAQSVCFANNNVKMFGGDPGVTAQINGATHMADEDIGVLRSIPNIVIFEPADTTSMENLLPEILEYQGPVYIRLLRKNCKAEIYSKTTKQSLFKIDIPRVGRDITLAASGIMVSVAMEAATQLADEGISAEVLDVHTIKPIDTDTLINSVKKTGALVSCENHNVVGGLGAAIAEKICKYYPIPMEYIGIQDHFGQAADQDYLMKKFGMTSNCIVDSAKRLINKVKYNL